MGKFLTLIITSSVLLALSAQAQSKDTLLAEAKQRCAPEMEGDPAVYRDDFRWGYNVEEMTARYEYIYNSGKRLQKRAYYDPATDAFYMDRHESGGKFPVKLSEDFLISLRQHFEESLKRDYVQFIFFPDLGHAHLFIPENYYEQVIKDIPFSQNHVRYEKMLNFPATKLLYHTAEQLHMVDLETKKKVDDEFVQWRYFTRNLVGGLKPPAKLEIHKLLKQSFNTVRNYPGYKYWGAGFDISASKDGCFPFKTKSGEVHYFDLSFYSLEMKPGKHQDWGLRNHKLWDPYHHMNH